MSQTRVIRRGKEYSTCFGCGPDNDRGLQMTFREIERGVVECRYTAPDHYRGPVGIIHGGIQATLLDEVLGMAVESGLAADASRLVTASFMLRYKRSAPTTREVLLRGSYDRAEGRNHFAMGELFDPEGNLCTSAEARWVDLSGD